LPFPKSARILRSADFRTVYDQGLRVSNPLFAAFCLAHVDGAIPSAKSAIQRDGPRLGVTATRALGGAVVRNRIKRRLREAFRMHRSGLAPRWDIVINPRRAAIGASFAEIEQALMKVIGRCGR
jgi:ribonuclease P protein component